MNTDLVFGHPLSSTLCLDVTLLVSLEFVGHVGQDAVQFVHPGTGDVMVVLQLLHLVLQLCRLCLSGR